MSDTLLNIGAVAFIILLIVIPGVKYLNRRYILRATGNITVITNDISKATFYPGNITREKYNDLRDDYCETEKNKCLRKWGMKCYYCDCKLRDNEGSIFERLVEWNNRMLEIDHVIPAFLGGEYVCQNLVPSDLVIGQKAVGLREGLQEE